MIGSDFIAEITAAYAKQNSYADTGEITTDKSGAAITTTTFATWFVRPQAFRFDFSLRGSGFDLGEMEKTCRIQLHAGISNALGWWTHIAPSGHLNDLLLTASVFSAAASYRVPSLLMPELFPKVPEYSARLRGSAIIRGTVCHAADISWKNPAGSFVERWYVGSSDFLIRAVAMSSRAVREETSDCQDGDFGVTVARRLGYETFTEYLVKSNDLIDESIFVVH